MPDSSVGYLALLTVLLRVVSVGGDRGNESIWTFMGQFDSVRDGIAR